MLEALEQRQEQIIADFMERAFESKHEHVENLKASFRQNKQMTKDDQKS